MPKPAPDSEKIDILRKILEKKELLFGDMNGQITTAERSDVWKEIFEYAKSQGYSFTKGKMWPYLRNDWWPNQKKLTLAKRDKKRPTGGEGGADIKYSIWQEVVLDIIGRQSALAQGLGESESYYRPTESELNSQTNSASIYPSELQESIIINDEDQLMLSTTGRHLASLNTVQLPMTPTPPPLASTVPKKKYSGSGTKRVKTETTGVEDEEIKDLRTKKLKLEVFQLEQKIQTEQEEAELRQQKVKLQILNLQLQNYNMRLDAFKKENELNVSHQINIYEKVTSYAALPVPLTF